MNRLLPAALLLAACSIAQAHAEPRGDLRNFTVGMDMKSITTDGYINIACAADPATILAAWTDAGKCVKDAKGLHEVHFDYADDPMLGRISEDGQGTKIAGQPVVLTLLIDDAGTLQELRMITDPANHLFAKRRADIFALQAMARYGQENWTCTDHKPTEHRQPLGTTFVDQHCEKTADSRHYTVDRALYHDPDLPLKSFVSSAAVSIAYVSGK